MAKITQAIPPSAFELAGDMICNILQEELDSQVLLTYDETICTNIYLERFIPLNESEFPAIIVQMANLEGDPSKVVNGDGVITYNIDVYYQADDTQNERADLIATRNLKKTAGLIRSILKNPSYRYLNFPIGVVGRTVVSRINIVDTTKQDTNNTIMARIQYEITATDNYELLNGTEWTEFVTRTNIDQSDSGYQYKLEQ
jgi:hypothetical protein